MPVDKWITWGLFPVGNQGLEDAPGQERALRDERREVAARVGAGGQGLSGGVGRVDPAGGDDLERPTEARPQAPHVLEHRGKDRGAGEAPRALREARLL